MSKKVDSVYKVKIYFFEGEIYIISKPSKDAWSILQSSKSINIMKKDKKAESGKITFIIPTDKKRVGEIQLAANEVEQMFE